jgi:SNF2 family DNA or RNA helicase
MKPFKPPRPINSIAPSSSTSNTSSHKPSTSTSILPVITSTNKPPPSLSSRYYAVFTAKVSSKVHKTQDGGFLKLDGRTATLYDSGGKYLAKEVNVKFIDFAPGSTLRVGSFETESDVEISSSDFISGKAFLDGPSSISATSIPAASSISFPFSSSSSSSSYSSQQRPAMKMLPQQTSHLSATKSLSSSTSTSGPRYDPLAEGALILQEATDNSVAVVCDPFLSRKLRPHQREGIQFLWRCIAGTKTSRSSGCILADDMGLGKTLQTIALIWTALKQSGAGGNKPLVSKCVIVTPATLVENWRQEFSKWLGNERCRPLAVTQLGKEAEEAITTFSNGSEAVQSVLILSYEMLRKNVSFLTDSPSAAKIGLLICDEGHRLKNIGGSKTLTALAALPTARRIILTGTPLQNNLEELFALTDFVRPNALGNLSTFRSVFEGPISAGRDARASEAEILLSSERSAELARRMESFVLRRMADSIAHSLPSKTETLVFCRLTPLQVNLYKKLSNACSSKVSAGDAGQVLVMLGMLRKICAHPDLVRTITTGCESSSSSDSSSEIGIHQRVKSSKIIEEEGNDDDDNDDEVDLLGDDESISISDVIHDIRSSDKKGLKRPRQLESRSTSPQVPLGTSAALFALMESNFPPGYHFGALAKKYMPPQSSSILQLSEEEKTSLSYSSKLLVLSTLLTAIRKEDPSERVVVASLFASVLNLIEALCQSLGYPVMRLDGTTPVADRLRLVTRFNDPKTKAFVFLLSSKAGGAGINLIGANRLISMDLDWNPATDAQVLARIWREGQLKPCFIYRLISAFTVEEKILQRQMSKNDLAAAVSGKDTPDTPRLSRAELLELFSMDPETGLRSSTRGGVGLTITKGTSIPFGFECDTARMVEKAGKTWPSFSGSCADDPILEYASKNAKNTDGLSSIAFVFVDKVHIHDKGETIRS